MTKSAPGEGGADAKIIFLLYRKKGSTYAPDCVSVACSSLVHQCMPSLCKTYTDTVFIINKGTAFATYAIIHKNLKRAREKSRM